MINPIQIALIPDPLSDTLKNNKYGWPMYLFKYAISDISDISSTIVISSKMGCQPLKTELITDF